jgi:hypothetical protein
VTPRIANPKPPVLAVVITSIDERWPFPLDRAYASVLEQTRKPDFIITSRALPGEDCGRQKDRVTKALPPEVEWVAYLDDDDYFFPQHIELLEQRALATGADMVYPWFEFDRPTGGGNVLAPYEGKPFDPEELRRNNYIPVTVLLRRSVVDAVGGFPPPNPPAYDDWLLWLRLLDHGAKIEHLPERTWMWTSRHSTYIHKDLND